MALKYTGRSELHFPGDETVYRNGDTVPISPDDAAKMALRSRLHSFEDTAGADVLDAVTAPAAAPDPVVKGTPKAEVK